ncbi:ShlB/FhaC/HecB family hemolysin secretion/activation protein [Leptolyngbya cf. ectocarpi LEGE 11479]|uniref:ShlB/FhaC/HecB family hemolysin secretion/activation protein n=1 Tax=Leptolyngbya cf. ectocarpi LEGE 11479 TaxID=1828722 RepID=A0A928ZTW2_LEPEC|nr:ShlB/FhaC/HecB family hemolysin secretion/activation protein [Leptolyngbya ectocarpi]MBE9067360.1 ShlB/FhaC/HecB family hemolysin secretion/activation protein [Leptolyngbya cf. ectocarpi LEGE 11479]
MTTGSSVYRLQRVGISHKYLVWLVAIWLMLTGAAIAQTVPSDLPSPVDPAVPSLEPLEPEPLPEEVPLEVAPTEDTVDRLRDLSVCPPLAITDEPTYLVTAIEVVGSTVLGDEIAAQVACYQGQELTLSDLLTLRSRITQVYVTAGYITSGAFLPNNQDLTDGTVQIQMVEGQIEAIQVNGLRRLNRGYVRDRMARVTQTPLNQENLEAGLQLLQLDPLLDQVNAELTSGSSPGLSLLILDVQEADPFTISFTADNYRAPSIGSEQGTISADYTNILGLGDRLSGSFSLSEGLNLYDIGYEVPINARNGTVRARFNNSDSRIVEDPFDDIDIRSDATTVSVGVRQPLWQSPAEEFALGLDFDWRRSRSFILDDIPFSFSVGPENGESQVSVLRFYQDWVKRDSKRVLAARSQFSLGLDLFDATVNDSGTDGRFFAWQGQFQWVEQLSPRLLLLSRVNGQLTPDSLLPIERFSVGGIGTVRGYAQNQLVADNALTGSVELRVPISGDPNYLQLTPFIEAGAGWNNRIADPDPSFLLATGLGLRWQISPEWFMRVDYGIPLVDDDNSNDSLQESGIYLLLNFSPEYF